MEGISTVADVSLRSKLKQVLIDLLPEAFATLLLLSTIGLSQKLFEWWIGKESRFFDILPIRWAFDAAELSIILTFLWRTVRKGR
jgi:hypothetical protein